MSPRSHRATPWPWRDNMKLLRPNAPRARAVDITGQTFGRLTVVAFDRFYYTPNGTKRAVWLCRCECGKEISVNGCSLKSGNTKGCGCVPSGRRHGFNSHPLRHIWNGIMRRCHNPLDKDYENYGGRGIFVCQRWHDFINFAEDMSPRPSLEYSVGRLDNDGPYDPENCRWETVVQQGRNKRSSRFVTVGNDSATVSEWAERTGIKYSTLLRRLDKGERPELAIDNAFNRGRRL